MAVQVTPRLGVTTWGAGPDIFDRTHMDGSHLSLESKVAGYLQGEEIERPLAAARYEGFIYFSTDFLNVYYCDGEIWQSFNTYDSPSTLTMGSAPSEGTGREIARATHVHGMPAFGGAGANVATVAAAGAAVTPSRSDHVHKIGSGAIDSSGMFDTGVVNANAMGALSVAAAAIQADAVTNTEIGALAVSTSNFQNGSVTEDKLDSAGGIDAGLIGSKTGSTVDINAVPELAGEILTSGQIHPDRLPSLPTPPVGSGSIWFSTNPPSGYIFLRGQELSRTTYAAVYALWGQTYGSGNGVTTFNVPDGRGRLLTGKAASGTAGTLGAKFGSLDHTHTISSHTHGVGSHSHTYASHQHTVPAHTHGIGGHAHTGPSHKHDFSLHTHAGTAHTHGFGQTTIEDDGYHSHGTTGGGSSSSQVVSTGPSPRNTPLSHTHSTTYGGTHSHGISGTTGSGGSSATGGPNPGTYFEYPGDYTESGGTESTGGGVGNTDQYAQDNSGGSGGTTGSASGTTDSGTGPSITAATDPPSLVVNFIAFTNVYT